jgi:hypothetical protein
LLSNQPFYIPDYVDVRIDVDRLPGDRVFVQYLGRYNNDLVLKNPSNTNKNILQDLKILKTSIKKTIIVFFIRVEYIDE